MKRIIVLMLLIMTGSALAGDLRLTSPNGGEKFLAGGDIIITWEGVAPNDPVKIEYRTDDNQPWITITESAVGLSYPFRVPKIVSKKYLVRISTGISKNEVEICDLKWMSRNLDVDSYRNGDPIRHAKTEAEWMDASKNMEGAWSYYDDEPANGEIYGKLYNWFAVNDPRGLAPYGWHVPTVAELDELMNCLGGDPVAGGKLKSTGTIETGDGLWSSPNSGATNESGFSALPGGVRNDEGKFYYLGMQGVWWSSIAHAPTGGRGKLLEFNSPRFIDCWTGGEDGCSVRCVREMQSDTSDAYWEVVLAIAASHDIDMKQCLVDTDRDSLVTDFVQNKDSWEFRVDDIYFTGADASAFSLVSGLPVYTVAAGASKAAKFRFKPTEARKYEADIVIITQASTLKQKIYGEGVQPLLKIVNDLIDFGRIPLGRDTTLRQAITIANIGNGDLKISDIKITNPAFTRISGSTNDVLMAGDTLKYDLKFTTSQIGPAIADLEIYHNQANSPTKVKLIGEGYEFVGTASATLQALNISAYSGDIIELPIILKNQEYLSEANVSKIKVDLFFNPTLLYPLDYPLQAINNQIAKITLDNLPANKATGEALARVKFKAALGNAEDCELTLDNAEPIGGTANINLLPGSFSLLGICHEGGTRLVNPNANIGIQKIAPIPGKDKFTVTAKVTEADTKIRLIALNGKIITEIDCPINKEKAQDFVIDLSEIAAGIYFIEFKSATFSQMEKVMVEK